MEKFDSLSIEKKKKENENLEFLKESASRSHALYT